MSVYVVVTVMTSPALMGWKYSTSLNPLAKIVRVWGMSSRNPWSFNSLVSTGSMTM